MFFHVDDDLALNCNATKQQLYGVLKLQDSETAALRYGVWIFKYLLRSDSLQLLQSFKLKLYDVEVLQERMFS